MLEVTKKNNAGGFEKVQFGVECFRYIVEIHGHRVIAVGLLEVVKEKRRLNDYDRNSVDHRGEANYRKNFKATKAFEKT